MTSAYLLNHSNELIQTGLSLLKNIDQLKDLPPGHKPHFWGAVQRLKIRAPDSGLSCQDIFRGVAVLESYKMTYPTQA